MYITELMVDPAKDRSGSANLFDMMENLNVTKVFVDGVLIHYSVSAVAGSDYIERYELHGADPRSYVTQFAGADDWTIDNY